MVAACFIWLIRALVSRARPLRIPRMHGRIYGVVDCMCQISVSSTTRFIISSGDISSKIGATSQRSLRRLNGGYVYIYDSGIDADPDIYSITGLQPNYSVVVKSSLMDT